MATIERMSLLAWKNRHVAHAGHVALSVALVSLYVYGAMAVWVYDLLDTRVSFVKPMYDLGFGIIFVIVVLINRKFLLRMITTLFWTRALAAERGVASPTPSIQQGMIWARWCYGTEEWLAQVMQDPALQGAVLNPVWLFLPGVVLGGAFFGLAFLLRATLASDVRLILEIGGLLALTVSTTLAGTRAWVLWQWRVLEARRAEARAPEVVFAGLAFYHQTEGVVTLGALKEAAYEAGDGAGGPAQMVFVMREDPWKADSKPFSLSVPVPHGVEAEAEALVARYREGVLPRVGQSDHV